MFNSPHFLFPCFLFNAFLYFSFSCNLKFVFLLFLLLSFTVYLHINRVCHFWPLFKRASFLEAAGAAITISKLNQISFSKSVKCSVDLSYFANLFLNFFTILKHSEPRAIPTLKRFIHSFVLFSLSLRKLLYFLTEVLMIVNSQNIN